MTRLLQGTFAAGELAPALLSRTDLPQYAAGCRTLRNFIVRSHGAASNRPGTRFVAAAKIAGRKARVVRFQFSDSQAYILEFGHQYMRVYKDGGPILNGGVPVEIVTPYSEADLPRLTFAQSADVLFIAHPGYAPRVLTRYSHTLWTMEVLTLQAGPFMLANADTTKTLTPSGTTGDVSLASSFDLFDPQHVGGLFQINHFVEAATVSGHFSATGQSSAVACKAPWRLVTHGTWSGAFRVEKSTDGGTTWTVLRSYTARSDKNYDITGEETEACLLRVKCTEYISGQLDYDLTVDAHIRYGVVRITGVTDARNAAATVLETLGGAGATDNWAEGSWSDYRGWPATVGFFEDRLCFANNANEPQTVWMSQTSDYTHFGISVPMVDTDRLAVNLVSRSVQAIRWLVDVGDLITLTNDAVWAIGAEEGPLTPTTAGQKRQDGHGSAHVEPAVIGNQVLYVETHGTRLRAIAYSLETAGYRSVDLSLLAAHLTEQYAIVDLAVQQEPDPILWMVRADGVLLGLTYVPEQGIVAWHWHDTDGAFESLAVIPADGYDELWAVVRREIGGTTVRYVERFASRKPSVDSTDWFHVDCGLSYSGDPATGFSGLGHLEGKEVSILADGVAQPRQTVTGGKITLTVPASKVHVGLPYTSDLALMGFVGDNRIGSLQAQKVKVGPVTFRFEKTIGGKAGPNTDRMDPVPTGPALFSGLLEMPIPADFVLGGTVCYRQEDPLPVTVLAVMTDVEVGR